MLFEQNGNFVKLKLCDGKCIYRQFTVKFICTNNMRHFKQQQKKCNASGEKRRHN